MRRTQFDDFDRGKNSICGRERRAAAESIFERERAIRDSSCVTSFDRDVVHRPRRLGKLRAAPFFLGVRFLVILESRWIKRFSDQAGNTGLRTFFNARLSSGSGFVCNWVLLSVLGDDSTFAASSARRHNIDFNGLASLWVIEKVTIRIHFGILAFLPTGA